MYVRRISGKTITATTAERQPGNGFYQPAFEVTGNDGYAFPRLVVAIQNMTHSSAAHALQLAEHSLEAIAVDENDCVRF